VKLKKKASPPRMTLTATHHSSKKKGYPMLTQVPHFQITGFKVPHPYIEYMHSYWLKLLKVMSSLLMYLNICKPSASGLTPIGWTLLDLTYGDKLPHAQISGSKPHKRIPSSVTYSYISRPINKSKFKLTIKYVYNSRWLQ
jgi:hypothetical protein